MSLEQEINDAIRDGLTGLTLWRVGASTIMWQSASRWHGHDAFCVAIEADPIEAQRKALALKPEKSARIKKAEPAPAPAKKPSLDDWDDEAPAAPIHEFGPGARAGMSWDEDDNEAAPAGANADFEW